MADSVGKHVLLTRDTELITSYRLTLTTSSQQQWLLRVGNLISVFTVMKEFKHDKVRGDEITSVCVWFTHPLFPVSPLMLRTDWRVSALSNGESSAWGY